jgi:FkbM family methyltransferase
MSAVEPVRPVRWVTERLPWGASVDLCVPVGSGDPVCEILLRTQLYFPWHYELLPLLAPEGSVVLDLGGHVGTFSLPAATLASRVVSVEASPRNADLLRASAAANGFDHLVVSVVAVSDVPGTVRFRQHGAWGQITTTAWDSDVVEVPAQPVPEILAAAGVDHVDLVKMDVEGSEPAALAGMAAMLEGPDAPAFLFESNTHTLFQFGTTPNDVFRVFDGFGYELFLVADHELIPMAPDEFQPDTVADLLAVKALPDLPTGWRVRDPRTDDELAAVVVDESRSHNVDQRAAIAHALEYAPPALWQRFDVRCAIEALHIDPSERVARAAAWWVRRPRTVDEQLQALADQGHALHDRVERITARWAPD